MNKNNNTETFMTYNSINVIIHVKKKHLGQCIVKNKKVFQEWLRITDH